MSTSFEKLCEQAYEGPWRTPSRAESDRWGYTALVLSKDGESLGDMTAGFPGKSVDNRANASLACLGRNHIAALVSELRKLKKQFEGCAIHSGTTPEFVGAATASASALLDQIEEESHRALTEW